MARQKDREAERREAARTLDRMRHEAGGALTGREARERWGLDPDEASDDPPLDYRLTPRNIIIQVIVIAIFAAVAWFIVSSFIGGAREVITDMTKP